MWKVVLSDEMDEMFSRRIEMMSRVDDLRKIFKMSVKIFEI